MISQASVARTIPPPRTPNRRGNGWPISPALTFGKNARWNAFERATLNLRILDNWDARDRLHQLATEFLPQ